MGSFAPQEKNGITLIVEILSFLSASVRVFIVAGTEQPNPIIIGINALPLKPNFLNSLSRINATLAIYPLSSRIEKNINNTRICGKNPTTANSPPSIPSQTSPVAQDATSPASIAFCTAAVIESVASPNKFVRKTPGEAIPSVPNSPSAAVPSRETQPSGNAAPINNRFSEKVRWNIAKSINKKTGIPHILCVSTLSALSERLSFSFFVFSLTITDE